MTLPIDTTFDGHVHTRLCHHAVGEMEDYVRKAVDAGLAGFSFLEHMEVGICYQPPSWLDDREFDFYFQEGARLKERFRDIIEIQLGVELGLNAAALPEIRQRLRRYPIERIGLSCHFYPYEGRHLNLLTRRKESLDRLALIGAEQVVTTYLDTLLHGAKAVEFDVLCHLDAVLRHLPGIHFTEQHQQQISDLLDLLNAKNAALEINTSGFDYRGTAFPAPWIVGEALRRSIPLQAGSDAHHPDEVGRHFDRIADYLRTAKAAPPLSGA
ncbi:MAG: histidinol-phosphatase [Desulfobulbus sp.]|jgi:histidinol-phosphatase (PHP family)